MEKNTSLASEDRLNPIIVHEVIGASNETQELAEILVNAEHDYT